MGGVQWDGDRHGGAGTQPSAVNSGQAEAVEQAKAFHLTVAARMAVFHSTGLDSCQQRQAEPQEECHYALEREQIHYLQLRPF